MPPLVRQAVVIVHGIGEQRPMATLPSYVYGVVDEDDLVFSGPDRLSGHSDQRRMKVTWLPQLEPDLNNGDQSPPTHTDFFELYWAYQVRGTEMRHVISWVLGLLRHPGRLTPRFRRFIRFHVRYWWLLVIGLAVFVTGFFVGGEASPAGAVVRWAGALTGSLAAGLIVSHLGDVPRYVHNVADNVSIQRSIRRQGVELLRRLHDDTFSGSDRPRYERIIVVGHSLGSIVAYDIVRDYWTEANRFYAIDPQAATEVAVAAQEVDRLGEALWHGDIPDASRIDPGWSTFQHAQRKLVALLPTARSAPPRSYGRRPRWAITDLVTLASPLAHADFLLARDQHTLSDLQWDRSLATCPPRRQIASPTYRYSYVAGPRRGHESWHQAAPFAFTRWTNVYFESDVVGGPLRSLFGPGIVDIELARPSGSAGAMPRVHSLYDTDPGSVGVLRRVVWDGGQRDRNASRAAKIRSAAVVLISVEDHDRELSTSRLFDRLTQEQRSTILAVLGELPDHDIETIERALNELDDELIDAIRVLDILLNDYEIDDQDYIFRGLEGEEEEEMEEEEEE